MQIAAYTGGLSVPSARARIRQYIAPLTRHGINVREYPLPWGNVLPRNKHSRPLWMGATASARIFALTRSWSADLTWISRQLMPAFVPVQGVAHRPMVLDVDDAVWLNTGGERVGTLASASEAVVVGNTYLAQYFSQYNPNVTVIPTAIDTERFRPRQPQDHRDIVLGWTGTSGNFSFLYEIEDALAQVLELRPSVRLLVVADRPPRLTRLGRRAEFVRWEAETEVEQMCAMSIGLMPLADDPWCAGKCSYKMLCYMACGLPVVVSPVGMNREVLAHDSVGFGAETADEWVHALLQLIDQPELRLAMGNNARAVVERSFSLQQLVPQYAAVFSRVAQNAGSKEPL
jgi:glycosyltransferase involved in cell wall biosynthesis